MATNMAPLRRRIAAYDERLAERRVTRAQIVDAWARRDELRRVLAYIESGEASALDRDPEETP